VAGRSQKATRLAYKKYSLHFFFFNFMVHTFYHLLSRMDLDSLYFKARKKHVYKLILSSAYMPTW